MESYSSKSINSRFLEAIEHLTKDRSMGRITKTVIGEKVGIKQISNLARLSKQEPGVQRSVTVENCARLCFEFFISPEWLLLGIGEMKDDSIHEPALEEKVHELNRIVLGLVKSVARLEKAKG